MANRTKTQYKISIATVATALGVSDVQSVEWDGNNLIFRHTDLISPDTPLPNITRIQEQYTTKPWSTIKAQFFSSIPDNKFKRMSILIDATDIYVQLNLEE
jgi:hypothetical protein